MAYDKVIDSAALDANLTQIANAIRSKGGTSAALAFPAGFASAIAAIEAGAVTVETHDITIASGLTGAAAYRPTILQGSKLVKANYSKDGLFMLLRVVGAATAGAYNIMGIAQGNVPFGVIGSSNYYGMLILHNSAGSAVAVANTLYKLSNTSAYNAGLIGKSNGDVAICLPANRNMGVGTYELIIGVVE
jgi:hypothetical protein